jgi:hypothetical protein
MNLTRGAQRAVAAAIFAIVAGIYVTAWLQPALGLFHDDAVYLETAKSLASGHGYMIESLPTPIPQTKYPPLWPAVLTLFVLVSQNPLWLKLPALLCTAAWLFLSGKLLRKMGAGYLGALALAIMTAASPNTVFVATHLLSEPLFALLVTASLIALLGDRPLAAGALAGLATITRSAGMPLIVAVVLVLLARRRLRNAALFTAAAAAIVTPWVGWSLAHPSNHPYYSGASYGATNILTSLPLNEKLAVFGTNILFLLGTPFTLLSGTGNIYAALVTLVLFTWALIRRRQLVPDLFLAIYCAMLLVWAGPPQRFVTPVFPLALWIVWRAFQNIRRRELLAACAIILIGLPLSADLIRLPMTLRSGDFSYSTREPNDWRRMQLLFRYLRDRTPPDSVILANLDPVFYLNTGRKAIRGFFPDGYKLYYAPSNSVVMPDQLASEIIHNGVSYVALTPDRDFAEAAAYHRAVEALERGGMLEPVEVPGAGPDYRLLRVVSFRMPR